MGCGKNKGNELKAKDNTGKRASYTWPLERLNDRQKERERESMGDKRRERDSENEREMGEW